jgi:crotonobetainyl-CoA:carnitine CoA-transferase CaiB-like acyl-CoA transferase
MPYAGAYLADLGAEVIKVDTHHTQFMDTTRTINGPFPDNHPGDLYWERGGTFQTLNRGKRSLTLDLRASAALEIIKALVQVSDVLLENFTPRVMARFGLSYSSLRALKPDLIMVSNTGYGHSGPWSDFGAMASALEPTHGTGAFMGYLEQDENSGQAPGQVPNKMGNSYTDFLATWTALAAVLACLLYRARTGRGAWVDLAMYQVGASFIGEGLLDFAFNGQRTGGRRTRRLGNRHEHMAPHGCYPCAGNDSWVTLAVRDDGDWQALCRAIGQPGLASDPRFASPVARHRNQDELDPIIARWTSTKGQYQVMEALQALGVPAGPVLNARQLLADPHFRARGFFEAVIHPPETGLGRREYLGRGWKLSGSALNIGGPAPRLGEGNDYVLRQVLGLGQDEIDKLRLEGVIGEMPAGGKPPASIPLEQQVELGWTVEQDPDYRDFLSRLP